MKRAPVVLAAVLAILWSSPTHAAPTEQFLPFKAKTTLTAGRKYTFTFSLWDSAALGSGNLLWSESKAYRLPSSKVVAHVLGSVVPFSAPSGAGSAPVDFSQQLWVEVASGEFVRRYKLTAQPYALWSATADTLGIECATGQILVVDGLGEWACGSLPTTQLCTTGDILGCYTGSLATQGVGACRNGTRNCQSGLWGSCVGEVLPAPEANTCNGIDDDCDGQLPPVEADADGDGVRVCAGDCDDTDPNAFPGAAEICDGVDNNCDGQVAAAELDQDADGWFPCSGDCNDGDASINPDAPEVCGDGFDNDCNPQTPDVCEICDNGQDDDQDGLVDCDDPDCQGAPNCQL